MVKKIGGNRGITPTTTIETAKTRGVSGIGKVGQVGAVKESGAASGVKGIGRQISSSTKETLLRLVGEESEKLLADLPQRKRRVIEGAVKMALEGSGREEEE